MAYLIQMFMTPEALATLPEAEQALYLNTPCWVTSAFAVAVWTGLLGSLLLLLEKKLSASLFVASLIGVLAQNYYSFFGSNMIEVVGMARMILPISVIAVSIYLVYYSRSAAAKGWLK